MEIGTQSLVQLKLRLILRIQDNPQPSGFLSGILLIIALLTIIKHVAIGKG